MTRTLGCNDPSRRAWQVYRRTGSSETGSSNGQAGERNRLLGALPADRFGRLAPDFEIVQLAVRQVLSVPDQRIEHVYFPRDAVVTLLVPMEHGTGIEGATVGNEGMLGVRLARDRVGSESFPLTHEGLALLLGARRASISEVAEDLRRNGVIEYRRGLVTILDADCLEEAACEDYAFIRDAYDQVQPPD